MTSTDDVAGLCERLRAYRVWNHAHHRYDAVELTLAAADLIEQQANALREIEATLARVSRVDNSLARQLSESIATNAGLASERDTLRARLKEAEEVLEPFSRHAHDAEFIGPVTLARWCAAARSFSKAQGG